jgi:hypothetical protein
MGQPKCILLGIVWLKYTKDFSSYQKYFFLNLKIKKERFDTNKNNSKINQWLSVLVFLVHGYMAN